MNTIEYLNKIKAKCEELLAGAEKRTQGKWIHQEGRRMCLHGSSVHSDPVLYGDEYELAGVDGDFIASCAGPAEAGWRSTIAAIDGLLLFEVVNLSPCNGGSCMVATNADDALERLRFNAINAIISAWPEE